MRTYVGVGTNLGDRWANLALAARALRAEPRVLGFHRLRTRKSGSDRHVDLHVVLPARMGLGEAHEVARGLEAAVERLLPRTHAVVHVDPDTVVPPPAGCGVHTVVGASLRTRPPFLLAIRRSLSPLRRTLCLPLCPSHDPPQPLTSPPDLPSRGSLDSPFLCSVPWALQVI